MSQYVRIRVLCAFTEAVLAAAHRVLQENASLLSDEAARQSILGRVQVSREIIGEGHRMTASDSRTEG